MKDNFLSVIVPCYNAALTIEKTLQSILRQSWTSFEVLCVDDGSKDNTVEVIKNLAQQDNRIRLIQQPNQGVYTARMTGVNASVADWVTFVDADDEVEENHFYELMRALEPDVGMVVCGYRQIGFLGELNYETRLMSKLAKGHEALWMLLEKWRSGLYPMWNKLYSKNLFLNISIVNAPISLGEDQFFNGCILLANQKMVVKFIENIGYKYIQRKDSAITGFRQVQINDFFILFSSRSMWADVLRSHGMVLSKYKTINLDEVFNFYGKVWRYGDVGALRHFESKLAQYKNHIDWLATLKSPLRFLRLCNFMLRLLRSRLMGLRNS